MRWFKKKKKKNLREASWAVGLEFENIPKKLKKKSNKQEKQLVVLASLTWWWRHPLPLTLSMPCLFTSMGRNLRRMPLGASAYACPRSLSAYHTETAAWKMRMEALPQPQKREMPPCVWAGLVSPTHPLPTLILDLLLRTGYRSGTGSTFWDPVEAECSNGNLAPKQIPGQCHFVSREPTEEELAVPRSVVVYLTGIVKRNTTRVNSSQY